MAIAIDSQGNSLEANGTSATQSFTVGSGSNRKLWVAIEVQGGGDCVTGVTYAGVAMTQAVKRSAYFGAGFYEYLYYLDNPTSGANNIVASYSVSTASAFAFASYTGCSTGTDSTVSADGPNATTYAQGFTTVADNCWTINWLRTGAGGSNPAAGTGSFERTPVTGDNGLGLFDSNAAVTPAGSYTMNYTSPGSSEWTSIGASFSPSVAATATPSRMMMGIGT